MYLACNDTDFGKISVLTGSIAILVIIVNHQKQLQSYTYHNQHYCCCFRSSFHDNLWFA